MNSGFQFKQFFVAHEKCAMKVGTDGVIIGAWCEVPKEIKEARILDIGTGCGLIALMTAQRFPYAKIDAIDILPDAIEQARENFEASPWSSRLNAIHIPLQQHKGEYDMIVSNPPFFVNCLKNSNDTKTTARHTDSLSYEELVSYSSIMLKDGGYLNLILPSESQIQVTHICESHGLRPTNIVHIFSKPGKAEKRVLLRLTKGGRTNKIHEKDFYIEGENNPRSKEYSNLTKDFYL